MAVPPLNISRALDEIFYSLLLVNQRRRTVGDHVHGEEATSSRELSARPEGVMPGLGLSVFVMDDDDIPCVFCLLPRPGLIGCPERLLNMSLLLRPESPSLSSAAF